MPARFFLIEDVPLEDLLLPRGAGGTAHDSAFGACGGGVIELIEPSAFSPARVEERFSGPGRESTHRLRRAGDGRFRPSELTRRARAAAILSAQSGEIDNTLHDAWACSATTSRSISTAGSPRDVFGMVSGAAEDWDGSDPLRAVES